MKKKCSRRVVRSCNGRGSGKLYRPEGAGEEHFIKVDDAELSFLADDSRSVTVGVRAYPAEWSVESDASWIRYTESEGAVTITVAPNTGDAERKGVITVTAGQARQEIGIWQLGQSGFDGADTVCWMTCTATVSSLRTDGMREGIIWITMRTTIPFIFP